MARCGLLRKYQKQDFVFALGTVATERSIDIICLVMVVLLAFWLQPNEYFDQAAQHLGAKIQGVEWWWLLVFGGVLLSMAFAVYRFRKSILSLPPIGWMVEVFSKFFDGVKAVVTLGGYGSLSFALLTGFIWVVYFLTTYLWFRAIPGLGSLPATIALVVMVSGSVAKLLPVQAGGAGAYHILVVGSLSAFGVSPELGMALAVANHGIQFLIQLLVGAAAYMWLLTRSRKLAF